MKASDLSDGTESACNAGDQGSIPGVGKIPWKRAWQPTPVFLSGESHGQRSLAGCSPWGCKESDTTEHLPLSVFTCWRSHPPVQTLQSLACRSRSRLRMFSTCSTPRVYFSMYVSPSDVPSFSLRAAMRASVSRSSISSVA